jgi:isopenicillin-N epimerase
MNRHKSILHPDFQLDPSVRFLNHGSFGAVPREVWAAQRAWAERIEAQPVAFLWDELESELDRVVGVVAEAFGAPARDVALVENASMGISTVLRDRPWSHEDAILVLDHGYGGVAQAVQREADAHGVRVIRATIPFPIQTPDQAIDALDQALDQRPTVAILDHITSPTALVLPIEAMVGKCRERGVTTIVDGAHAPGHVPLNIPEIGADYYVGNLHKWAFAPRGSAFLWIAPDRRQPAPLVVSHGYVTTALHPRFHWTGTRDFTAWLTIPTALALHDAWGGDSLMSANRDLCRQGLAILRNRWGRAPAAPEASHAAMGVVEIPGPSSADEPLARSFSRFLYREHRIEVPILTFAGRTWARISAQRYNTVADYEALADAVTEVAPRGIHEIASRWRNLA